MRAQVLLVTGRDDAVALLPPGTTLPELEVAVPERALRQIAEGRARGVPIVAVIDSTIGGVHALVADCTVKYPEVPLILASPPGTPAVVTPSSAMRRPAGSAALLESINEASHAAVRQSRVRTTLDRINVRLRAPAAPPLDERQHRRLLLSGLYLSSILEQAKDAIFISDRRGVVALWNGGAERMFGVLSAEIVGHRIDTIGPARGGPQLLEAITALSHDAPVAETQMSIPGAEGPRIAQISFNLVRDEDGTGVAVCGIVHDVTERERLLRDVQEQAEALAASNRHKEEFLAVLSHELRTPLNTVLGWARMLETMPHDADRVRQGAAIIARNADLQHRLVTDLLDFARIAAGKLTLDVSPRDLSAVVAESVEAVRPDLRRAGLTVEETYAEGMIVPVDPDRVRQVVANLLSNAVKFTPAGGSVRIAVSRTADGGVLTVTDTGRGIAPEFLPHVFEAFRQADASNTGSQGLGLGLAIVRRIVEHHGGSIHVGSAGPGHGTTFTVFFPSAECAASHVGTSAAASSRSAP